MEIGPVIGIRPITMVKPTTSSPDLAGVFAIEFRGQPDETYSSGNQRASRGLEDEESGDDLLVEVADQTIEEPPCDFEHRPASPRKVSFFA